MRSFLLLALLVCLGGCLSDAVKDSVETVLTMRSGTMTELRTRRDTGPFRRYEVPSAEMLDVVEEVWIHHHLPSQFGVLLCKLID